MLTRRGFFGSSAAFLAASGFGSVEALLGGRPDLKFGVLSDIHIGSRDSTETFRKALRYFRDRGVDAVMICGDLANYGLAKAWEECFREQYSPVYMKNVKGRNSLGGAGKPITTGWVRIPKE